MSKIEIWGLVIFLILIASFLSACGTLTPKQARKDTLAIESINQCLKYSSACRAKISITIEKMNLPRVYQAPIPKANNSIKYRKIKNAR